MTGIQIASVPGGGVVSLVIPPMTTPYSLTRPAQTYRLIDALLYQTSRAWPRPCMADARGIPILPLRDKIDALACCTYDFDAVRAGFGVPGWEDAAGHLFDLLAFVQAQLAAKGIVMDFTEFRKKYGSNPTPITADGIPGAVPVSGARHRMVEFSLAYMDHTWDTLTVGVPETVGDDEPSLIHWFRGMLNHNVWPQVKEIAFTTVYHIGELVDGDAPV